MKEPLSYQFIPEIADSPSELFGSLQIHDLLYSLTDAFGNRSVLSTTPLLLDINFHKREFYTSQLFPSLRLINDPGTWRTSSMNEAFLNPVILDFQKKSEAIEREAQLFSVCAFTQSENGIQEVFEIYSHSNHPGIIHHALSKQDMLNSAYRLFLDRTHLLRKKIKKEPLIKIWSVPKEECFLNPNNFTPPSLQHYFFNGRDNFYLTRQEAQCANLLFQCRSASQIAKALNLSVRTVDHYINQIKTKLNCSSKSELYDALKNKGFQCF